MRTKKGLVYVFTGEGKGKTSAALGVAMRAVCNDMKVGWVSWYKEDSFLISERKLPSILKTKSLEMHFIGKGFYKLPTDKATFSEHKKAATMALKKAEELISRVDVLVLDEVVKAVADGLVLEKEVVRIVNKRDKTHLILTGRGAGKGALLSLIKKADLVTECKKVKHPFDKGIKAVKGLDF